MKCPECSVEAAYSMNREVTPGTMIEMYTCPDKDCYVVSFGVVLDK